MNTVSGMLLYAHTDETVQPNHVYHMSGNKISIRTLDLNCPFSEIVSQLDNILKEHFWIIKMHRFLEKVSGAFICFTD